MFAAQVKTRRSKAVPDSSAADRPKTSLRIVPRPAIGSAAHQALTQHPAIGNQAALRLLSAMQTRLRVSQPDDPSELEAERAADRVMGAAQGDAQVAGAPDHTNSVGGDAAVLAEVRGIMEPRFGADFSAVRIHNDAAAHDLADTFGARAFTVGRDIFFAQDQFAPASDAGRRLIAHELAHVVQQGAAGPLAAGQVAASGADLMRQVEEPEPAQAQVPEQAPEMTTPMPEEQPGVEDEEGAESEISLDDIGFTLPALSAFEAGAPPSAGLPRIDRQPKKPKPKPKAAAPKPSGVTVKTVQVLPDAEGATTGGTDGETDFKIRPHFTYKTKNGKISSFSGTVSRTIQTTYQPKVDKNANSAYGRGTTAEDKKAGNTSLHFHESSHVEDYKDYFDKNKLPEFTGKEGMTEDEFKKAVDKYGEELKKYSDAAKDSSKQNTDCVGTKEKTCQ